MFERQYFYNDNYFEVIDSKVKAYWLGFFYADGYITKTNIFGCALKQEDRKQLENFLNEIGCPLKVLREEEKTNSCRFALYNKKLVSDLYKLGFTTEKSYDKTLKVWNNVPDIFKKDFLLGLWDGDGSFSIQKRHDKYDSTRQMCSLISNNDLLIDAIIKYINNSLEEDFCKLKPRTDGDPYPRIRIGYNKAKIFGDWLYKDIDYPILTRKYEIYKQFKIGTKSHAGLDSYLAKGIICIESGKCYATAKECCLGEFGIDNPGAQNGIRQTCRGEQKTSRGKHFRYMTEEEKEQFKNGELNL